MLPIAIIFNCIIRQTRRNIFHQPPITKNMPFSLQCNLP
jgi:hypothetical protein